MTDKDKLELIDRALLRPYMAGEIKSPYAKVVLLSDIIAAPAIPVVHCKDCALRGEDECPMMWWEEIVTDDDGFCHKGRRTDDEAD